MAEWLVALIIVTSYSILAGFVYGALAKMIDDDEMAIVFAGFAPIGVFVVIAVFVAKLFTWGEHTNK